MSEETRQRFRLEYAWDCAKIVEGRIDRLIAKRIHPFSGKEQNGWCVAGSVRRKLPTVKDLDLNVVPRQWLDIEETKWEFAEACVGKELLSDKEKQATGLVRLDRDSPEIVVEIRFMPWEQWGAALMAWTGSADYNENCRGVAKKKGLTLNEHGIRRIGEDHYIPGAGASEASVCRTIRIPWLHPWEREGSCFPRRPSA